MIVSGNINFKLNFNIQQIKNTKLKIKKIGRKKVKNESVEKLGK